MKALGKKILLVMEFVGPIAKDAHNDFHQYDYVSDAAVVRAMREGMIKYNLVLIPSYIASRKDGDLTTVEVDYTLIDVDSGESIISHAIGYGSDKGDKGIYKAQTGAEKYYLTKTFLIPTGDDPEKEAKIKPAAPKSWPAPQLSAPIMPQQTVPNPVSSAIKEIVRKNVPIAEVLAQEILNALDQEADGDEVQVALLLKEATKWTPRGTTEQRWLKPEDLGRTAKSNPEWIERIHKRIVTN